MTISRVAGIVATCTLLLGPAAFAQSVYIDFGSSPAPSSGYTAASGVPGYWNSVVMPPLPGTPLVALLGLQGEATSLVFTASNCFSYTLDFPNTSGDAGALYDDWFFGDAETENVRVAGLSAGVYQLYFYPSGGAGEFVDASVVLTPAGTVESGPNVFWGSVPAFPGDFAHALYASILVHVPANDTALQINYFTGTDQGLSGMQLLKLGELPATFCAGDGSGSPCPCNNFGLSGHGCENSFFSDGALLVAGGTASVSADTLVLGTTRMSGLVSFYLQGTAPTQNPIDDGLGCLDGQLIRIGVKSVSNSISFNPSGVGDLPLSVKGAIPPAGGTRYYQAIYRNSQLFCTPATTNRTNGISVAWTP